MTDQTNWDTQPMAGWKQFEEARARFLTHRRHLLHRVYQFPGYGKDQPLRDRRRPGPG